MKHLKSTNKKKIHVCFDLDGVLIGKPAFLPKKVIELVVRGKNSNPTKLHFRYPTSKIEEYIRWLSQHPYLRRPLTENIKIVRELSANPSYKLSVVSGRYQFLEKRTYEWLQANNLDMCFSNIFLNTKNVQPHLFKERVLKQIKADIFFEDDEMIIRYLKKRVPLSIVHVTDSIKFPSTLSTNTIAPEISLLS